MERINLSVASSVQYNGYELRVTLKHTREGICTDTIKDLLL